MATLNVYLADLPGNVRLPAPLRRTVQAFFDQAVGYSSSFSNVSVQWTSKVPPMAPYDLLVYFVDDRGQSVVRDLTSDLGDGGTTYVGDRVASEVYLGGHGFTPSAEGLGKLAIHELMHNVTKMGESMHKAPGLALGKKGITAETTATKADKELVGKHLKKRRTQWKDGFLVYHDPMR